MGCAQKADLLEFLDIDVSRDVSCCCCCSCYYYYYHYYYFSSFAVCTVQFSEKQPVSMGAAWGEFLFN